MRKTRTNTDLLKKKIFDSGATISILAKELGLSRPGLSKKIHNKSAFWADEMDFLCKALKIKEKEKKQIFFADSVPELETTSPERLDDVS